MAGRSRWLVGSSSTRQLVPRAMRRASSARVRSPGDSVRERTFDFGRAQSELGQQRTCLVGRATRWRRGSSSTSGSAAAKRAWPGRARRTTTPGPIQRSPVVERQPPEDHRRGASSCPPRSARGSRAGRPSRARDRSGPSCQLPRRTRRRSSRATTSPLRARRCEVEMELPGFEGFVDRREALEGAFGDAHLGGLLLGAVDPEVPLRLVVVLRVLRCLGARPSRPTGAAGRSRGRSRSRSAA